MQPEKIISFDDAFEYFMDETKAIQEKDCILYNYCFW